MSDVTDNEELSRFREQWKAEVRQRTKAQITQSPSTQSTSTDSKAPPSHVPVQPAATSLPVVTPAYTRAHHSGNTSNHVSKSLASALETYRSAVHAEQAGDLDEALRLYRQAFRLDSNVDKAYHKEELRLAALAPTNTSRERKRTSIDAHVADVTNGMKRLSLPTSKTVVTGNIAEIISNFPPDVAFGPEDERQGVPLQMLPGELLILILKFLDPSSIERFALSAKKARIISLDSSIWRELVQETYLPPQIQDDFDITDIAEKHMHDFRRIFIEYPRLRLDGVYIAVCHYVRPGWSENRWVAVSHLITYHRYLRFLPDGTVLSLLVNEDMPPQAVIPLLNSSLRMKGLLIGSWSLHGSTVFITGLSDPSGVNNRYNFQMTLTLRSRPLGRWNKLDFAGYDSVNMESGEAIPLALKHERPFWFSKVKSYV